MNFARNNEDGSASVELAVIAPIFLLILGTIFVFGRLGLSSSAIDGIAASAARQASLARNGSDAKRIATQAAKRSLADQHLSCQSLDIVVDTTGFRVPVGQPANVSVAVTCFATLSELGLPGIPGTKRLVDHFTSPLDPNRSRTP